MKVFRRMVTMLCALAMVLALAPAVFAEELPDPVDTTITVTDGNATASGDVTVTTDGKVDVTNGQGGASTVEVGGTLTNEGTITSIASGTGCDPEITAGQNLTNNGTITVTSLDKDSIGKVKAENTLTNNGTLAVTGDGVMVISDVLINRDTLTVTTTEMGGGSTRAIGTAEIQAASNLTNEGTMTVYGRKNATIFADDELVNAEDATLDVSAINIVLAAGDSLENHGDITLAGKQVDVVTGGYSDCNHSSRDNISSLYDGEEFKNYGTITVKSEDNTGDINGTYYGFNYVDKDGNVQSLLEKWTDGKEGKEVSQELTFDVQSREGYTFGGWQVGDTVYQPGDTVKFNIHALTNIVARWNEILKQSAPAPSGSDWTSGEPEKEGEEIKEVLDLRVLDADRKELTKVDDFYLVARTTRDRLIVLFTDVQLKNLPSGENLFYIILPDGTEVEYTLSIA